MDYGFLDLLKFVNGKVKTANAAAAAIVCRDSTVQAHEQWFFRLNSQLKMAMLFS
jgi:hypothetical protein